MSTQKYVPPHRRRHRQKEERITTKPWQQHPPPTLKSLQRDQRNRKQYATKPCSDEEFWFFGDSFIGMFKVLAQSHPFVHVTKFKGASAKGIGRPNNDNRATIESIIRQELTTGKSRLVFCFGSVDVHLSYYYTRINNKGVDSNLDQEEHQKPVFDLFEIAESYLAFVHTLTTNKSINILPQHITIVGIYPSPLMTIDDVRQSVCKYGAVPEDQLCLIPPDDLSIASRQRRVREYNNHLRLLSQKYGFNYDDLFDEMIDATTNQIKPSFQDVSSLNIHVVWETSLLLWREKWPWLKRLIDESGIEHGLQKDLEQYLKTKTWTGRTHMASTLGIHAAVEHDRVQR